MATITRKPDSVITKKVDSGVPAGFSRLHSTAHESAIGTAKLFERLVTTAEVLSDLLAVVCVVLISQWLHARWTVLIDLGKPAWHAVVVIAAVSVLMLEHAGAYHRGSSLLRVKETERGLQVVAELWCMAVLICFFAIDLRAIASVTKTALLLAAALISEKHLLYLAVRWLHARGKGVRRVVIVGAGHTGKRVLGALMRSPKLGLDPVALVDDHPELVGTRIFAPSYRRQRSVPVRSGPVTSQLLRSENAGAVIVAAESIPVQDLTTIIEEAAEAGALTAFVPNRSIQSDLWVEYADIDGLLISSVEQPKDHRIYGFCKRIFDVIFAIAVLVATLPIWLVIVLLVKNESAGPAIFVQKRVGKDGELFDLYKFRSMFSDSPAFGFSPRSADDPRVTMIGRFLRRSSLDELPQLLNVIKGDMSLVGPRPEMPFIVEQYSSTHWQRLRVKPGLTGLWQISADRAFLIHENLDYDLYYIRNRSFFIDIAILLHTFFFAMRGI